MKPAIIRIERIGSARASASYWRVWIFTGPRWSRGRCRGATTLREAIRQAREARRDGVW